MQGKSQALTIEQFQSMMNGENPSQLVSVLKQLTELVKPEDARLVKVSDPSTEAWGWM